MLDGYDFAAAHIVGMSMGGMIAQLTALDHPQRVLSLTAISTSPVEVGYLALTGQHRKPIRSIRRRREGLDWSDRDAVIGFMIKDMQALAGPTLPFDEAAARALVANATMTVRSASPARLITSC